MAAVLVMIEPQCLVTGVALRVRVQLVAPDPIETPAVQRDLDAAVAVTQDACCLVPVAHAISPASGNSYDDQHNLRWVRGTTHQRAGSHGGQRGPALPRARRGRHGAVRRDRAQPGPARLALPLLPRREGPTRRRGHRPRRPAHVHVDHPLGSQVRARRNGRPHRRAVPQAVAGHRLRLRLPGRRRRPRRRLRPRGQLSRRRRLRLLGNRPSRVLCREPSSWPRPNAPPGHSTGWGMP